MGDHGPVGFSAYATTDRPYDDGDVVQFDAIVSNIGNHYSPDTYKFTCPYNGLYLFNVNFVAYSNYQMTVKIVHEHNALLGADAQPDFYQAASASVVTECSE